MGDEVLNFAIHTPTWIPGWMINTKIVKTMWKTKKPEKQRKKILEKNKQPLKLYFISRKLVKEINFAS